MAKLPEFKTSTLMEVDRVLEQKQLLEKPRHYLGMSQIGHPCWRHLFYSFRGCKKRIISASGIKAIQDGYDQENKMAERLRMLPYIELHTTDPENPKEQTGHKLLLDHFRGHMDGMIKGIKEAPLTWHVWEHKSVNQTKFNKLQKLIFEKGEKNALQEWDEIYFAQDQIYMHEAKVERHYLTVSTPGGRDYISCRTNYNKKIAEGIITKAQVIIFENWDIPERLSKNREFYLCKRCEFQEICHDGEFPLVNCKTCRYSEPIKDGKRKCLYKDEIIDDNVLYIDICQYHIYNPALISAKLIEHQKDCCIYETENGFKFANCISIGMPKVKDELDAMYTSLDLYNNIKSTYNLNKTTASIQKEFNGKILNKEETKNVKAWDKVKT